LGNVYDVANLPAVERQFLQFVNIFFDLCLNIVVFKELREFLPYLPSNQHPHLVELERNLDSGLKYIIYRLESIRSKE
jgi:hypothetical protein